MNNENTLTIADSFTAPVKVTFAELKKELRTRHPLAKPKEICRMAEEQLAAMRQDINKLQQECVAQGWRQEVKTRILKSGVRVAEIKYTEPEETAVQKAQAEAAAAKAEIVRLRAELAAATNRKQD
jgi:hypothetical protein